MSTWLQKMEVVLAFLHPKIIQNKEKLLYSLFYYMEGSKGQAAWPQGTSKAQPQPLHPAINDAKYAV